MSWIGISKIGIIPLDLRGIQSLEEVYLVQVDIRALDPLEKERKAVEKSIINTHASTHSNYTMEIQDVFKLNKEAEEGQVNNLLKNWKLFRVHVGRNPCCRDHKPFSFIHTHKYRVTHKGCDFNDDEVCALPSCNGKLTATMFVMLFINVYKGYSQRKRPSHLQICLILEVLCRRWSHILCG